MVSVSEYEEITAGTDGTYEFAAGLSAGILNIVKKGGSPLTVDSTPQTIEITKALKPTGVGKTDCISSSNNDGTITGVDASMEYRKSGVSGWTAITGSTVTNLTPGAYLVRTKAAEQTLASESISLTIEERETLKPVKQSQELKFTESRVTLKIGDEFTNTLSGAKTAVSFKSSDEAVASVGDDGKVTAIAEGTTTIMAEAGSPQRLS